MFLDSDIPLDMLAQDKSYAILASGQVLNDRWRRGAKTQRAPDPADRTGLDQRAGSIVDPPSLPGFRLDAALAA